MTPWMTVFLLQATIAAIVIALGVTVLRVSVRSAVLACLLMMPGPFLQVAGGAGSWIFAADLLVVIFAIGWVASAFFGGANPVLQQNRTVMILALLLVTLPILSTLIGFAYNAQPRSFNFMALQSVRAIGYYVLFRAMVLWGSRESNVSNMLLLQCLCFVGVAVCGLAQFRFGVNLDLWNQTLGNPFGEGTGNYGGGFMGLYRGAVGAWAAGILGIIPIVMANRHGWNLLMPFAVVAVVGSIFVTGSRQGLAIGAVSFVIGLTLAVRALPPGERLPAFFKSFLAVGLLLGVSVFAWSRLSQEKLGDYVTKRFEVVLDPSKLIDAAINRDYRVGEAWNNITSDGGTFVFGVGYGVEQLMSVPSGKVHIYIDSELFYMWQLGGTVLIIVYFVFLLILWLRFGPRRWPPDTDSRATVAAGLVTLYGGMMLMWGHFFILTTFSHEAPIGYWTWAVFGLAVGASSRARSPQYEITAA